MRIQASHRIRRVVLAICLLVLVSLVAVWGSQVRNDNKIESASKDATRVAKRSVQTLLSYTPDTVMTELPGESKLLAGSFRRDYVKLVTEVVGPAAKAGGVTTQTSSVAEGVIEPSADRVEVLLFVNVTTTSTDSPDPRLSGSRLHVTLSRSGDTWLITALDPV